MKRHSMAILPLVWMLLSSSCTKNQFKSPDKSVQGETKELVSSTDAVSNFPTDVSSVDSAASGQGTRISECSPEKIKSLVSETQFPVVQGCNLKPDRTINLPANATICSIDFVASGNSFFYGDTAFVTLENMVVIASNNNVANLLPVVQGIKTWDFNKVSPAALNGQVDDGPAFCQGSINRCIFPPHRVNGPVDVSLTFTRESQLVKRLAGKISASTGLFTIADDDDPDCSNTELNLQVTVKYELNP